MKAFYYRWLLLTGWLAALGTAAVAQTIPNNGFDTWADRSGNDAPAGWLTSDDYLAAATNNPPGSFETGTVTKSTDTHSGAFAAKLTTLNLPTTSGGTVPFPGILILGAKFGAYAFNSTRLPIGGSPYTARPAQFNFYYKLTGPVADSTVALAVLTITDPTTRAPITVGAAGLALQPTTGSGYAAISIPIQYGSSATPDSVRIQFISSASRRTMTAGTTLLVDDITLSNSALAVRADASTQAQLTVSPNPSPAGRFQISAPEQPALASAPYTVLDVTGRVVAQQPALAVPRPTRELDLSSLASGIYMLRLDTKQGTLVRQLSIQ